jgi:hypothetical protein
MRKSMRLLGISAMALTFSLLSGCKSQDIVEDTYSSFTGSGDLWEVSSSGPVRVEIDPKGEFVRVTGQRAKDRVAGTVVKVTGKMQFKLFDVQRVVVSEGAECYVTNSAEVNARDNTKLHIFSCGTVRVKPSAKLVEVNGTANIIKLPANAER